MYSAVFQKARALFLCEKNKTKKQLTIPCFGVNIFKQYANALIAQLDRVTGYEPVGRGFESLSARHGKSTCSSGAFFIYRTVAEFFYYRSGKLYSCPDKFFLPPHITSPTCCLVAAKRKAESLVSYDLYFAASDVPVSPSDFGGKKKTNDFFKERVK